MLRYDPAAPNTDSFMILFSSKKMDTSESKILFFKSGKIECIMEFVFKTK